MQTGSEQRRDRARSIITMVTGIDYDAAGSLLRRARWNVKAAIVMEKTGDTHAKALARLKRAGDSVRDAVGEDVGPRLQERLSHTRAAR
jgi:N-acetylmuramic acid 6-phosphate (MurNAc-6-P) etherase